MSAVLNQADSPQATLAAMAAGARQAARSLAQSAEGVRNAALHGAAAALRRDADALLAANARDLDASTATAAFRDRLTLTPARIEAMAAGLEEVAGPPA